MVKSEDVLEIQNNPNGSKGKIQLKISMGRRVNNSEVYYIFSFRLSL